MSASFFRVLAAHGAQVLDVEQSLFRSRLSLGALVGVKPERLEVMADGLAGTLKGHGMTVEVSTAGVESTRHASSHAVVVLGNPLTAEDIARIGQTLADYGANIDTIRGIADYPVTGLELKV